MPSSYTPNYQLNQWAAGDQVLREDFNADNEKVDAAIRAVEQKTQALSGQKADQTALEALRTTVEGKASQGDLAALQSTVSGLSASKADQSGLDALEQTVAALSASTTAALAKKGNLRVETGSYLGTGTSGQWTPSSLTFAARPLLVVISGGDNSNWVSIMLVPGQVDSGQANQLRGANRNTFFWSGTTLNWYDDEDDAYTQMNAKGVPYYYIAFYQAG